MNRRLISAKRVAELLDIKPGTVYDRKGGTEKLTKIKVGRLIKYFEHEVEALIDRQAKKECN